MPACSPLDLCAELHWPDPTTPDGWSNDYLPQGGTSLDATLFPRGAESGPPSLYELALRVLPPTTDFTIHTRWPESFEVAVQQAIELAEWPTVAGIIIAARYLAFRRHAKQTLPRDVAGALALACPATFATALQRRHDVVAAALERHRRRAIKTTDEATRDHLVLLAAVGPRIFPSKLSVLIPHLIRLLGPGIPHRTRELTDANAMTLHLLRPGMPGSFAEAVLADQEGVCSVDEALSGVHIEHARTFVWRVFRRTIAEASAVDSYVEMVLSRAGIEAPPVEPFWEEDVRPLVTAPRAPSSLTTTTAATAATLATGPTVPTPPTEPTAPIASVHERLKRGIAALARLTPCEPRLVAALAGKAALLGTDLPPASFLLSGGTAEEREYLLRTLAMATDTAFVAVDASSLMNHSTLSGISVSHRDVANP